jgi:tRNA pseudouridine38-40 synthase
MNNYQLLIEYVGTKFVGWQKQKKGISVQNSIEKVLRKLTKRKSKVYGSGRTDAGVHAIKQSAHFRTEFVIKNKIEFINSINFFLKKLDIVIIDIKKRKSFFHARHSAKKRTYKYIIINRQAPLALEKNRAWNLRKKLNLNQMKKGANFLRKNKDFSTFRASSCGSKTAIKILNTVRIKKTGSKIEIIFTSKSFLQQQVRSMVGCLKYLGEGKWSFLEFKRATLSKKRTKCAPPAPACGLYLLKVNY